MLRGLAREGFKPFMVAQGLSRIEGKTGYTKHMIRLRHGRQGTVLPEANEVILINRCYGGGITRSGEPPPPNPLSQQRPLQDARVCVPCA